MEAQTGGYFMKTILNLSIAIVTFSALAISASDKDLERAMQLSRETAAQEREDRETKQALAASQLSFNRDQERRAAEQKRKNEERERQERERKMLEQKEKEAKQKALNAELIVACRNAGLGTVKICLSIGANIEARDVCGATPLARAVAEAAYDDDAFLERRQNLIRYLIGEGVNINAQDNNNDSIIMIAAWGPTAIFKQILEQNPDLSLINHNHQTVFDVLKGGRVLSSAAKMMLLKMHLERIEQENKAKIEAPARPILVAATNNPIADLILDYVGQASYPLSDELRLPFTPKTKSQDAVGFVKP